MVHLLCMSMLLIVPFAPAHMDFDGHGYQSATNPIYYSLAGRSEGDGRGD